MRRLSRVVLSFLALFASLSLSLWGLTKPALAQSPCDPAGTEIARVICPPPMTGRIWICLDHHGFPQIFPQCFMPSTGE